MDFIQGFLSSSVINKVIHAHNMSTKYVLELGNLGLWGGGGIGTNHPYIYFGDM